MAPTNAGVPGLPIFLALGGAYLVYAGIRDVPLADGLRELVKGKIPQGRPKQDVDYTNLLNTVGTSGPNAEAKRAGTISGGTHPEFAQKAMQYIGVPYKFARESPSEGFDCSGLVQYVLRSFGIPRVPRIVSTQRPWRMLKPIPMSQVGAGDLVFWGNAHIGFAINNSEVVHAPKPGDRVKVASIKNAGPGGTTPDAKRYIGPVPGQGD